MPSQFEILFNNISKQNVFKMLRGADRSSIYKMIMAAAAKHEKSGVFCAIEAQMIRERTEQYWGKDGIRAREWKSMSRAQRLAVAA